MTEQESRRVVGDGCQCWVTPESQWTTHYGAVEPGSQVERNPQCREHPMHALAIWCPRHQAVESLTTIQAEELIHGLYVAWFDEMSLAAEEQNWASIAHFCPTEMVRTLGDPEMYAEHIEANVDARIVAELGEAALR